MSTERETFPIEQKEEGTQAHYDFADVMRVLEKSYLNVMRIDLTEDIYEDILADAQDMGYMGKHFSSGVRKFVEKGGILEEDAELFLHSMNIDTLCGKLDQGSECIYYTFRRLVGEEYHWVSYEIIPTSEYCEGHKVALMYIRDINDMQNEILAQQKLLRHYAYIDALTGLINRTGFNELCEEYLLHVTKHSVGVIFADLNSLKYINDTYGHSKGDEYLKYFSDKLLELYGLSQCYRISGDEFIVVMQHLSKQHFEKEYRGLQVFIQEQQRPMAAIGMAWAEEAHSVEAVLRVAEEKMYKAKRDYYCKYQDETTAKRKRLPHFSVEDESELSQMSQTTEKEHGLQLDKSGLSNRIFDVFALTARRGYLFLCNMRTGVSRWSKRALQDFALPDEYMYNVWDIWESFVHPDDLAHYQEAIDLMLAGEYESQVLFYRAKNKKGEYVLCSCQSAIVRGEGDDPDYFVGTITNYGIADTMDSVTHLLSKSAFLKRVEELAEEEEQSTVMMVIIDKLSSVNTLYGYGFGDTVLREFGFRMQNLVGENGEVYHIEGAMFGICMYDTDRKTAEEIYKRIRQMAFQELVVEGKQITLATIASAVVFGYAKGAADSITANLGYAIAQSQTKYHGNVVFYNIEKHKHEFDDRDLVGVIYQNIMNGFSGFSVYYQPIVNAQSGKTIGAEALVRWEDEKYGMVSPNRFIPFVEQNPCIFDLGNWVLRRALMDAQEMRKIIPGFILNVNIAAPQLAREEFRESVMQALADTGYPAKNLCLELTERCRELDFEFMRQEITFFREKGIRVAMDDFGTGNASLQLVLELPIDEIKIDRTFLRDIESRKINQVLVSAAAIGAQTIGADVCIEGVEDQRMATYLQVYEPTYYQGYHYAKPLPKEEFLSLISS